MFTIIIVSTKTGSQNLIFSLLCIGYLLEGGRENGVRRVVRVELLQCTGYVLCGAWVLHMWYMYILCGQDTVNSSYIPYSWLCADLRFGGVCSPSVAYFIVLC
jgi:hypothetical protein